MSGRVIVLGSVIGPLGLVLMGAGAPGCLPAETALDPAPFSQPVKTVITLFAGGDGSPEAVAGGPDLRDVQFVHQNGLDLDVLQLGYLCSSLTELGCSIVDHHLESDKLIRPPDEAWRSEIRGGAPSPWQRVDPVPTDLLESSGVGIAPETPCVRVSTSPIGIVSSDHFGISLPLGDGSVLLGSNELGLMRLLPDGTRQALEVETVSSTLTPPLDSGFADASGFLYLYGDPYPPGTRFPVDGPVRPRAAGELWRGPVGGGRFERLSTNPASIVCRSAVLAGQRPAIAGYGKGEDLILMISDQSGALARFSLRTRLWQVIQAADPAEECAGYRTGVRLIGEDFVAFHHQIRAIWFVGASSGMPEMVPILFSPTSIGVVGDRIYFGSSMTGLYSRRTAPDATIMTVVEKVTTLNASISLIVPFGELIFLTGMDTFAQYHPVYGLCQDAPLYDVQGMRALVPFGDEILGIPEAGYLEQAFPVLRLKVRATGICEAPPR